MARYVKVGSIGAPRLTCFNDSTDFAQIESMYINHWKAQFDNVLPNNPDLIVVNEMCDIPLMLSKARLQKYHELCGDHVFDFFRAVARDNHCCVVHSGLRIDEKGCFRNSSRFINRDGKVTATYNKNYATFGEIDEWGIKPDEGISIVESEFGKIGLIICFDLNFEELRAKYAAAKPDILAFSSLYHGGLMQNYWAYSCRAHFIGAVSNEQCTVISPVGELLAKSTNYFNYVTTRINLDCKVIHLDRNEEAMIRAKKKYGECFRVSDPGYLGAVMISSESEEIPLDDIIKDAGFELLDDYFARYLVYRGKML